MVTTPNLPIFVNETSNLEVHWTSEDGRLRSRWSITPQMKRLKPLWLESVPDRTSTARQATLKIHSSRVLYALCWFLVFAFFVL